MLSKESFDSLNIEGKNTLKDDSEYNFISNYIPDSSSDEISNYIINSNITNKNLMR